MKSEMELFWLECNKQAQSIMSVLQSEPYALYTQEQIAELASVDVGVISFYLASLYKMDFVTCSIRSNRVWYGLAPQDAHWSSPEDMDDEDAELDAIEAVFAMQHRRRGRVGEPQ